MTKSFSCEHGGVACNATVSGATEEEVLEKAIAHARKKHGVDLTDSQTLARYAQTLIRDDSAAPAEAGR